MSTYNVNDSKADNRIYGLIAWGELDKIISVLQVLRELPEDDENTINLKVDIKDVIASLKLNAMKGKVLHLTIRGVPTSAIADYFDVSRQYIHKIRNEIIKAISDEFKQLLDDEIDAEQYKALIESHKRYGRKIDKYVEDNANKGDQADKVKHKENEGSEEYPTNSRILERDEEYYKGYKGLERDPE